MNTKITKVNRILFLMSFSMLGLLTACTQEEDRWTDVKGETITEVITDLDARRITSFKVVNPGEAESIYSSVNNIDKTITVYLPAYYQYQYLETAITLPEKTTISPASGELIPVFASTPSTYTTKAADGTTAVYTVKIVIQQDDVVLNDITKGAANYTIKYGNSIEITGANFLPSYAVTKLFIVDAAGTKKWQMQQYNEGLDIFSFSIRYVFSNTIDFPAELNTETDYWFMIESYNKSTTMALPFRLTK